MGLSPVHGWVVVEGWWEVVNIRLYSRDLSISMAENILCKTWLSMLRPGFLERSGRKRVGIVVLPAVLEVVLALDEGGSTKPRWRRGGGGRFLLGCIFAGGGSKSHV